MINSGKWSSYEETSDFPFFKKAKGTKKVQEGERSDKPAETSSPFPSISSSASPMKPLNMRSSVLNSLVSGMICWSLEP